MFAHNEGSYMFVIFLLLPIEDCPDNIATMHIAGIYCKKKFLRIARFLLSKEMFAIFEY